MINDIEIQIQELEAKLREQISLNTYAANCGVSGVDLGSSERVIERKISDLKTTLQALKNMESIK